MREAGTENVRGGVAKKYRYVNEERREAPAKDPAAEVEAYAHEVRRRFLLRKVGGKGLISDAEMWVTPEVWERVEQLVRDASRLIHDEAQRPRTEGTIKVNMQAFLFEMNDDRKADR